MRSPSIVALSLLFAACGQDDSGNVMAVGANALSPEQVDAALGPELANAGDAPDANAVDAAEAAETADLVEEAARPDPPAESEPEPDEEPDQVSTSDNNIAEE